ncbi:MAG: hypothetical protein K6G89_07890 [Clostridia bacterium]|nr:hypothetical protein [Clostridia bacterium]
MKNIKNTVAAAVVAFAVALSVVTSLAAVSFVTGSFAEEECSHTETMWVQISDGCAQFCMDCGKMLTEEQPHDWKIAGTYDDEEDFELYGCTGMRHRGVVCSRCECFGGIDIEPLGHKYVNGVCERCGDACNHDGATHVEGTQEATCTAKGFTGNTVCDICGGTVTEGTEIPALGHDYVTNGAADPTCVNPGSTGKKVCSVCGDVKEEASEIPALGHSYINGVCERCGEADPSVTPVQEETEAPEDTKAPDDDTSTQGPSIGDSDGAAIDGAPQGCGGTVACGAALLLLTAATVAVIRKKTDKKRF